ncbi:MAG: MinD/ParA family protein [Desulfomicrobium sp.]|jgi:flagellar biosynthesis protein FlhG|nr:MinD/ParA family protein [Desulfomicrobium sp.]NLV97925.1 MinD/ParA family protein [Desulfovibrionales bacterium]
MSAPLPIVLSVTSGKGGVGKTNISTNLAICLSKLGYRCVILDADLGLANVDVLLGLTPQHNLFHVFHEKVSLEDILFPTPYGFSILPASSGMSEMLSLSTGQKLELLEAVDILEDKTDFLIVDTGAGINDNALYFNLAVQERLLVITPEPTSLTDAYALIKVLKIKHGVEKFHVLINMAQTEKMARGIFAKLYAACDHFLSGVSLSFTGYIPFDSNVRQAVIKQHPFCSLFPQTEATKALEKISQNIAAWKPQDHLDGNIKFFWKKLLFGQ